MLNGLPVAESLRLDTELCAGSLVTGWRGRAGAEACGRSVSAGRNIGRPEHQPGGDDWGNARRPWWPRSWGSRI